MMKPTALFFFLTFAACLCGCLAISNSEQTVVSTPHLPSGAELVAQAGGTATAAFTAPTAGVVYVVCVPRKSEGDQPYPVYSGPVRTDQTVAVNPNAGQIKIQDQVTPATLQPGNTYQVWFVPEPKDAAPATQNAGKAT